MAGGTERQKLCFRDRDYLMDKEGMLFCVIGNVHPPDRVISYLKYVPQEAEKESLWKKGNIRYSRILPHYSTLGVLSTQDYLKRKKPEYLYDDPFLNISITAVLIKNIETHFLPEERLKEIFLKNERDPLEEEIKELVSIISKECEVNREDFGVTGSVLLEIHDPKFSDIDLVIYGRESSKKVLKKLPQVYESCEELSPLTGMLLERRMKGVSKNYHLEPKVARKLLEKAINRGLFKGRQFSIHPVKREEEVEEKYGQTIYEPMGILTIVGRVENCDESIFMPSRYLVSEVRTLDGKQRPEIKTDDIHGAEEIEIKGKEIVITCRSENKLEVISEIRDLGIEILDFRTVEPSLEDAFVRLLEDEK